MDYRQSIRQTRTTRGIDFFFLLFTRRINVRMSDDFPEAAPFVVSLAISEIHRASTRQFDRFEIGDRAIHPLYFPSPNSPEGRRYMLVEPIYSSFVTTLQDALHDTSQRSTVARALMQNDLWSAYDRLFEPLFPQDWTMEAESRRQLVLGLLGQLIRKVVLRARTHLAMLGNWVSARPNSRILAKSRALR